jgi:hypothetical protein
MLQGIILLFTKQHYIVMKKLLALVILTFAVLGTQAQTLTFNNNTTCGLVVINVVAADAGTCAARYSGPGPATPVPGGSSHTFTPSSLTSPSAPTGPITWITTTIGPAQPVCPPTVNNPPCGPELGENSCSPTYQYQSCFTMNVSCNTCPLGTTINLTWTVLPTGDVVVDAN